MLGTFPTALQWRRCLALPIPKGRRVGNYQKSIAKRSLLMLSPLDLPSAYAQALNKHLPRPPSQLSQKRIDELGIYQAKACFPASDRHKLTVQEYDFLLDKHIKSGELNMRRVAILDALLPSSPSSSETKDQLIVANLPTPGYSELVSTTEDIRTALMASSHDNYPTREFRNRIASHLDTLTKLAIGAGQDSYPVVEPPRSEYDVDLADLPSYPWDEEEYERNHSAFVADYDAGKLTEGLWYTYHKGVCIVSGATTADDDENELVQSALDEGCPLVMQAKNPRDSRGAFLNAIFARMNNHSKITSYAIQCSVSPRAYRTCVPSPQ